MVLALQVCEVWLADFDPKFGTIIPKSIFIEVFRLSMASIGYAAPFDYESFIEVLSGTISDNHVCSDIDIDWE